LKLSNDTNKILSQLSEKKFTSFYEEYYSSLCFFANRYLNNAEQAEDIVGEVAFKIWERRDSLKHTAALKNYFYISVRNACLDYLRHEEKKKLTETELVQMNNVSSRDLLENIIYAETLRRVEKALLNLPPQCRKVFTHLFIEGKTLAETAQELQLSIHTIKNQRQRGLKILRHNLTTIFLLFVLHSLMHIVNL
jgi:RNA polymerase sigma-70 factor (family 1)